MVGKVELIPIDEGNRITVKENEKVIVGRGSSLGCNEKKISRHHAELLLKDNGTLWIKPTHANPVFYRPSSGKTSQLPKDVERELKDGDYIGLLPSTFYFRVSFSTDVNNNNNEDKDDSDSDSDSVYGWKQEDEKSPPARAASPDDWSPTRGYRRSTSNQNTSVFDFDDDLNIQPTRTPSKRVSLEAKPVPSVEPKPRSMPSSPSVSLPRASPAPSSTSKEQVCLTDRLPDEPESTSPSDKTRKLPKWMAAPTPSPVSKSTTPKPSLSRSSSYTAPASSKRHLSFEGDSNDDTNESSNMSDVRSPGESKLPGKVLSKIPSRKSVDSDTGETFDTVTARTPPPKKKIRPGGKRRPACQFGASCYRKNPSHRAEQSHPGDSDYDDADADDDDNADKPECPFGKSCYRQNPQHKRDFRH